MVQPVGGVGRIGQRGLVAGAAERVVHQLHRHHAGGLAVPPQPPPYRVTQRQHRGVGLFGLLQIFRHRHAVAVAVVPGALLGQRVGLTAVGVVPQRVAPGAKQPHRRVAVHGRQLTDGIHAPGVQPPRCAGSHAEQIPHRQRPHLGGHFLGEERMHLVGLFKV